MIHFQLVSLTGIKFDEAVYEVLVPTDSGEIGIFKEHMPLVSKAVPGVISVRKKQSDNDGAMERFSVMGGLIEVDGESVRFLADEVAASDEINEKEAAAALSRAHQLLKDAKGQVELQEAQRQLQSSSVKLQLAKLKSRHHR